MNAAVLFCVGLYLAASGITAQAARPPRLANDAGSGSAAVLSVVAGRCSNQNETSAAGSDGQQPDLPPLARGISHGDWLCVSWNAPALAEGDLSAFLALVPASEAQRLANLSSRGLPLSEPAPLLLARPTTGRSGAYSVLMLNFRGPTNFLLLRGSIVSPSKLLGVSPAIGPANPNEPTGIHLLALPPPGAGADDAVEVGVQWTTADEASPTVFWGPAPRSAANGASGYPSSAAASSSTLSRSALCGDAPASSLPWAATPQQRQSNATRRGWLPPGTQHTGRMGGLDPGRRYFYSVGGSRTGPLSAEQSFIAPPSAGGGASLSFVVAADIGASWDEDGWNCNSGPAMSASCPPGSPMASPAELSARGWDNRPAGNTSAGLAAAVAAGGQLLLLNGDLSYARGFGAVWEQFLFSLRGAAGGAAVLASVGNHEENWGGPGFPGDGSHAGLDSGGECGVAAAHRFPPPAAAAANPPPKPGRSAPWYSFAAGAVRFTVLSTEHSLAPGSPQLAWLAADLAEGARLRSAAAGLRRGHSPGASGPVFLVVVAHRFRYACTSTAADAAAAQQQFSAAEPLFAAAGVELVLTGHHHSYQRTCGALAGRCAHRAPVYLVAGHAGAGLHGVAAGGCSQPGSVYAKVVNDVHGYLVAEANATALVIRALRSDNNEEMDRVVIESNAAVFSS